MNATESANIVIELRRIHGALDAIFVALMLLAIVASLRMALSK